MDNFLLYLLKSTLSISLLYLLFRTLMRKETFFALNRLLLLTIIACSTIIPLLYLPQIIHPTIPVQLIPVFSENENQLQELPVVTNEVDRVTVALPKVSPGATPSRARTYKVGLLFQYVYLAGMLITFLILIHGLVTVLLLFRKAQVKQMDGFRLLIINKEISPFSFGRFVIISQSDYDAHSHTILAHEQAHIRLNHFYDLLLLEMAKIFHWFNPVIYWLIRDMKEIHEFQADDYTLTKGIDATKYQLLIIQKCVGPQRFALANSFNHCQIKKRITMMNKQKTSKAWRWKVATFLPLLALLLMAFGKTGENVPPDQTTLSSIVSIAPQDSVKQWTEADFGKLVHDKEVPTRGFRGFPISLNSKSQLKIGGEFVSWEEASKQIQKFLDYNLASEEMKPEFEKITINGQERMAQKYNILSITRDVSTPVEKYQNLLNFIGKVVLEIRQKYANEIYKTSYQKLTQAQRDEIIKLIPAIATFNQIPILAPETVSTQPTLYIEIRAEGIFVLPDKNTVTIAEMKQKAELFVKGNGSFVDVRTAAGIKEEQVSRVKEALKDIEKLNVRYLNFDPVYVVVEQMAEFPGGTGGIREWISKNITYPEAAKAKGLEGKVYVSFVVNSKGKAVFPKVARGLSPELDAEALKLISQMPEWKPAFQNGIPVSISYTVPINFSLKQQ
jgi:TonB family protein